jgi:hypothetical protein
MSVFSVRNVLPVVTSVVATLFLATAVPHDLVPQATGAGLTAESIASAEVQRCVANGRDTDDCLDEADGKALVERAEWLARDDAASRRASAR